MKFSIRRLSPVLTGSASPKYSCRKQSTLAPRTAAKLRCSLASIMGRDVVHVPKGYIPVDVGAEMKRFIINAELLTNPVIKELLNISAQEYGCHQQGVLRISCDVFGFERILEAIRRDSWLWIQKISMEPQ